MPSSILDCIFEHSEKFPEKKALIEGNKYLCYRELKSHIISRANYFSSLGIKNNDKILLIADISIEFVLNYFATHLLGAAAVPIDKDSNDYNINNYKKILKTNYLFKGRPHQLNEEIEKKYQIDIKHNSVADILFTSGTTNEPKGVMLTQSNIYTAANHTNAFVKNSYLDNELICMPFSHSFGLTRLRCSMLAGSTCILVDGLSRPKTFFQALDSENITGFGIVPAGWAFLREIAKSKIKKYRDQLKYIELGSSPMTLDAKLDLISCLPNTHVCMHYGSTEASRSCFLDFKKDFEFLDSVGRPSLNVNISILSKEGKCVKENEQGEVSVKGGMVSPGYINIPKVQHKNKKSYHRMGDIGYLNHQGYLYLVGRSSDIINIGGKKVAPQEVEILLKDVDGIIDCACIGVSNKVSGESLKALIVVRNNYTINYPSIKKFLMSRLEPYKVPTAYEIVDNIPYSYSGKIIRKELKNSYSS